MAQGRDRNGRDQSLLAEWQRGIAVRGIAGAVLLMVPVVVAAAIGFGGGLGVGLSSFTQGPSESAVNTAAGNDPRQQHSVSLDKLAGTIPPVVKPEDKNAPLGIPTNPASPGGSFGGPGAVTSPPEGGGVPQPPGSATPNSTGEPAAAPGIDSAGEAGTPTPAPAPAVTVPSNPITDLLNGLLGGQQTTGP